MSDNNFSRSWRHEPLLHFLLIGAVLFALYGLVNDDEADAGNRIEITDGTVARLTEGWKKTWRRPPTDAELQGLIEGHIREEVLVREALALGLDSDDVIIRRRLAQKMEFLAEDLAQLAESSETELRLFYEQNPDLFTEPARLSFRQIYFSTDRRDDAAADAEALLATLQAGEPVKLDQSGDRLMLDSNYELVTERDVARTFGASFAEALFLSKTDGWHGPFDSGYGLHVVLISARRDARLPELAAIREAVSAAWLERERKRMEKELFERMKSRYEIVDMTNDG